jgi:hypothetical protein
LMARKDTRNAMMDAISHAIATNLPQAASALSRNYRAEGGRTKRATGGRIPEADKMFKEAKKQVDSMTKPLLNEHDDAIVNALRIAKGLV